MSHQTDYVARRTSAAEAVHVVRDGDTICVPSGVAEPPRFLEALSQQRRELHDVTVSAIVPLRPFEYLDPETVEHVRHVAYFIGAPTRKLVQGGYGQYRANNFSEMPELIRRGYFPVDVFVSLASPMDADGYFSLSLGTDYTAAAISKARAVVLEVNPHVPYVEGDNKVHISQVTHLIEDDEPITTVGLPEIGPVQRAIGGYVADLIPDGATLQIGYGSIPDAVVMQLTQRRDLGIHTEMIGDGILTLIESGAVTNAKKNLNPGLTLATFAMGSERLYAWMDHNPTLRMEPVDVTNDPFLAGQNDNLHTINATLEIDLFGQCCSETIGATPYSGTGGQSDFVRAANRSAGGKSFIVMPSTAKGDTISRIVPTLKPGANVSTSKNDVNFVVTEFGVAQLRGKTNRERAEALIAIAHPAFREELGRQAQELHLL